MTSGTRLFEALADRYTIERFVQEITTTAALLHYRQTRYMSSLYTVDGVL